MNRAVDGARLIHHLVAEVELHVWVEAHRSANAAFRRLAELGTTGTVQGAPPGWRVPDGLEEFAARADTIRTADGHVGAESFGRDLDEATLVRLIDAATQVLVAAGTRPGIDARTDEDFAVEALCALYSIAHRQFTLGAGRLVPEFDAWTALSKSGGLRHVDTVLWLRAAHALDAVRTHARSAVVTGAEVVAMAGDFPPMGDLDETVLVGTGGLSWVRTDDSQAALQDLLMTLRSVALHNGIYAGLSERDPKFAALRADFDAGAHVAAVGFRLAEFAVAGGLPDDLSALIGLQSAWPGGSAQPVAYLLEMLAATYWRDQDQRDLAFDALSDALQRHYLTRASGADLAVVRTAMSVPEGCSELEIRMLHEFERPELRDQVARAWATAVHAEGADHIRGARDFVRAAATLIASGHEALLSNAMGDLVEWSSAVVTADDRSQVAWQREYVERIGRGFLADGLDLVLGLEPPATERRRNWVLLQAENNAMRSRSALIARLRDRIGRDIVRALEAGVQRPDHPDGHAMAVLVAVPDLDVFLTGSAEEYQALVRDGDRVDTLYAALEAFESGSVVVDAMARLALFVGDQRSDRQASLRSPVAEYLDDGGSLTALRRIPFLDASVRAELQCSAWHEDASAELDPHAFLPGRTDPLLARAAATIALSWEQRDRARAWVERGFRGGAKVHIWSVARAVAPDLVLESFAGAIEASLGDLPADLLDDAVAFAADFDATRYRAWEALRDSLGRDDTGRDDSDRRPRP